MAIDVAHCTAAGLGIVGTTTHTVAPALIQARDAVGNPVLVGGQVWDVTVNGVPINWVDNADGTYTVPGYIAYFAGDYVVSITGGGVPISLSPFTVTFTEL